MDWLPDLLAWEPDDWSALGTWITAGVAVAAGLIARNQLAEARRLRLEQAQPYVVLFMEPMPSNPQFVELVIRNLGATAALDVQLQVEPQPQQSGGDGGPATELWLPDLLPVLVPNQEWRTLWDFSPARAKTYLPDRHEAVVTYKDSHGKETHRTTSVLDWNAYKGRQWVTTYTVHDAAKALREINKTMGKWTEDMRGGLAVFTRSGEAKDDARRAEIEVVRARRQRPQVNPPAEP